jgi:hypothetical protein
MVHDLRGLHARVPASSDTHPSCGKPPSVAPRAAGSRMAPSWPAPAGFEPNNATCGQLPLWIARWEWHMHALARRRNRATLLSEAHVRGSGQSPDCSHENFALGWPRNDEARPAHTSVAAENAKWNSYSTTKLVVVKSCGVTNRKADESGTVPRRSAPRAIPWARFLHRPPASQERRRKPWLCRSSSAWPGAPNARPGREKPSRAQRLPLPTWPKMVRPEDVEHARWCNGHCRRWFCTICRDARCPGAGPGREGQVPVQRRMRG